MPTWEFLWMPRVFFVCLFFIRRWNTFSSSSSGQEFYLKGNESGQVAVEYLELNIASEKLRTNDPLLDSSVRVGCVKRKRSIWGFLRCGTSEQWRMSDLFSLFIACEGWNNERSTREASGIARCETRVRIEGRVICCRVPLSVIEWNKEQSTQGVSVIRRRHAPVNSKWRRAVSHCVPSLGNREVKNSNVKEGLKQPFLHLIDSQFCWRQRSIGVWG